jgi:hypothetical protein
MGLTRINILAGLFGTYHITSPQETSLGLPSGPLFDRQLVLFDCDFRTDGSLYMNNTGCNPSIHPQWQPEYFGTAIIVNGKAWPYISSNDADIGFAFSMPAMHGSSAFTSLMVQHSSMWHLTLCTYQNRYKSKSSFSPHQK